MVRRRNDVSALTVAIAETAIGPAGIVPGAGDVTATIGTVSAVSFTVASRVTDGAAPVTRTGHTSAPKVPRTEKVRIDVSPEEIAGGSNFAVTSGGKPVAARVIRWLAPAVRRVETRTEAVPLAPSRATGGSSSRAKSARGPVAKACKTSKSRRLPSMSVAWRRSEPNEPSGAVVRALVACHRP